MFVNDPLCLRHMLDAATEAVSFLQNRSRSDLDNDRMLTLSLIKCIEIIGEAASRITKERQEELSQIPWFQIIGMRNRLVHPYFEIELDIFWDTVTEEIPYLMTELDKVIAAEEQE